MVKLSIAIVAKNQKTADALEKWSKEPDTRTYIKGGCFFKASKTSVEFLGTAQEVLGQAVYGRINK